MQTFEKLEDLKEIVEKRMAQPGRHLSNLFGCLFLWSRQDVLGGFSSRSEAKDESTPADGAAAGVPVLNPPNLCKDMRKLKRLTIMVYKRVPLFPGAFFAFQKHESSQRSDQRKQGKGAGNTGKCTLNSDRTRVGIRFDHAIRTGPKCSLFRALRVNLGSASSFPNSEPPHPFI